MTPLSQAEFGALSAIAQARQQNLVSLFGGARVRFGQHAKTDAASKALKAGRKIKKLTEKLLSEGNPLPEIATPAEISETGEAFFRSASGVAKSEISEALGASATAGLVQELTPFLGVLYSVYKMGKGWKAVIRDAADLNRLPDYKTGVLPGDPLLAADAVSVLLQRKIAYDTAQATRHSATASAKIAGLFADLGATTTTALGLANVAAGLVLELAAIGVELKDMSDGNRRLAEASTLDATVFKDCPVLGAHLLVCSDTSAVCNIFVADIGLPGWMDKVEAIKKNKLDPLIKLSNKCIQSSRLTVEGVPTSKGMSAKRLSRWGQFKKLVKDNVFA